MFTHGICVSAFIPGHRRGDVCPARGGLDGPAARPPARLVPAVHSAVFVLVLLRRVRVWVYAAAGAASPTAGAQRAL